MHSARQHSQQRFTGFTLVELAVVIVVIAVLAAITMVSYTTITRNARGLAVVSDLQNIDKAFRLYAAHNHQDTWLLDNDSALTGSANPTLLQITAANSEMKGYLPTIDAAKSSGIAGEYYMYDNDGDTYGGCSTSDSKGVNIYVKPSLPKDIAQYIDDTLDDGNLSCGAVTYGASDSVLRYNLSAGQTINQ